MDVGRAITAALRRQRGRDLTRLVDDVDDGRWQMEHEARVIEAERAALSEATRP